MLRSVLSKELRAGRLFAIHQKFKCSDEVAMFVKQLKHLYLSKRMLSSSCVPCTHNRLVVPDLNQEEVVATLR